MTPPVRTLITAACLSGALTFAAAAQQAQDVEDTVTLEADQVTVERDGVLVAEGDVVVFAQGRRLRATRMTYDQEADRLSIEGPIQISDGSNTIILASTAELTPDLREGLVNSVRVILDQRLQIAAAQGQRHEGRFTDLREAVATSCEVCQPGEPPLWQIQASRVIHDQEEQRIYFENARFHILNVPVLYLPALSTPEPGVLRARGFLVPSTESSDLFGTGAKVPYFIPLGDHADITLAPYLATDLSGSYTRTLEYRYRQAFTKGDIEFNGAFSQDSVEENYLRAYVFGEGAFDLPHQTKLRFGIELVRDDAYLNDYDYSGDDRLENTLSLTRVVGDTRAVGEAIVYKSLRDDEDNDTIPALVGDISYDKRWTLDGQWGFIDTNLLAHGHRRPSDENIDGRDSTHLRGILRYSNEQTVGAGLRLGADARLMGDIKQINQDNRYERVQSALTPGVALTASLPMSRPGADGSSQLLEPIAQLVWTGDYDIDAPNDDSTQPGFDAGNLFGFSRYPGVDRVESGLRANLATKWEYLSANDWSVALTFGRVFRSTDTDLFTTGTGLDGIRSDWLVQADVNVAQDLAFASTTLIDDDATLSLSESRLVYTRPDFDISASYVWQEEDAALGQDEELSELTIEGGYTVSQSWSADVLWRRDLIDERTVRAGLDLTYQNECVRVDLSATRRFRNSDGADPTYSYGITVSLTGFGTGGGAQRRIGSCAG